MTQTAFTFETPAPTTPAARQEPATEPGDGIEYSLNRAPQSALPPELVAIFGEPISVYTRQQATKDGVLVDVSEWARETGIRVPTVFTRAFWTLIDIDAKKAANKATPRERIEDTRGRAHDALYLARVCGERAIWNQDRPSIRFSYTLKFSCRNYRVTAVLDGDGLTIGFPEDF